MGSSTGTRSQIRIDLEKAPIGELTEQVGSLQHVLPVLRYRIDLDQTAHMRSMASGVTAVRSNWRGAPTLT